MPTPETSQSLEALLQESSFDFLATGKHRTSSKKPLSNHDVVLLDVRCDEEVHMLPIAATVALTVARIPVHEIPNRADETPTDRPVAVFCSAGTRATMAYVCLRTLGLGEVRIMSGGLPELIGHALPGAIWKRQSLMEETS